MFLRSKDTSHYVLRHLQCIMVDVVRPIVCSIALGIFGSDKESFDNFFHPFFWNQLANAKLLHCLLSKAFQNVKRMRMP